MHTMSDISEIFLQQKYPNRHHLSLPLIPPSRTFYINPEVRGFLGEAGDFQCCFWLSPGVDFIFTSFQNTGKETNFSGHGNNPQAC